MSPLPGLRRWLLCLALGLSLPAAAHPVAPPARSGEPLPAGAVARLGTARLRHAGPVSFLAFSGGRTLASAAEDGTVRLWDVHTGAERLRLTDPDRGLKALALSPDRKTVAGARRASVTATEIVLWDGLTGRGGRRLGEVAGDVGALAISPHGRTLASGGWDQTVR